MGLFEKKFCDFCGNKIGLLGNKKLADGNMCKDCASRMSPWLVDRKEYTVAEMGEHFAYREANRNRLRAFYVNKVIGLDKYGLYIDMNSKQWFVSQYSNYESENPDIFDFTQVIGCSVDVRESRRELYCNIDGHRVSCNPPEYEYRYDFYIIVRLRDFIVSEIRFKINTNEVEEGSVEYYDCEEVAATMCDVFNMMIPGSQFSIPEPRFYEGYDRERIMHDFRIQKDMQRERMMAFERWHRGPQGGPPPHHQQVYHEPPRHGHYGPGGGMPPRGGQPLHNPHNLYDGHRDGMPLRDAHGPQGGYGGGMPPRDAHGPQGGYGGGMPPRDAYDPHNGRGGFGNPHGRR